MSESGASGTEPGGVPEALAHGGRNISPIWIFPLVAAIVGIGLAYRSISQQGPTITIQFASGEGIEAGKTTVRYKAVVIGSVESVELNPDLKTVAVTAQMEKHAELHMVEGARFWVVRPEIIGARVTGLGTLVSGAYIGFDPAPTEDKSAREFVGLEQVPVDAGETGGLKLVLTADNLQGLGIGSPVYYREIIVGEVSAHELAKDDQSIDIHVFIHPQYAGIVRENARFWNASGFEVSASWSGLDVEMESLRTLLLGGIAFDLRGKTGNPVKTGARFPLHAKKSDALGHHRGVALRVAVETPHLNGIKIGDPVTFRGETVGRVASQALHADGRSIGVRLDIYSPYQELVRTNSVFWNASGISAKLGLSGLHVHMGSLAQMLEGGVGFATPPHAGARAASGSVFELHPEVKDDWLKWSPGLAIAHGSKTGDAPAKDEPKPEVVHHKSEAEKDEKSHHWFHHLFHHGD